jgi:hypothetical protein
VRFDITNRAGEEHPPPADHDTLRRLHDVCGRASPIGAIQGDSCAVDPIRHPLGSALRMWIDVQKHHQAKVWGIWVVTRTLTPRPQVKGFH